jgi:hypothetical protein
VRLAGSADCPSSPPIGAEGCCQCLQIVVASSSTMSNQESLGGRPIATVIDRQLSFAHI